MTRMAWGAGYATEAADGTTLDVWFGWLGWGEYEGGDFDTELGMRERADEVRGVTVRPIRFAADVDAPPASAPDVYLRLHLLSHRLAAPRTVDLTGAFGLLTTTVWTSLGPVAVADLDRVSRRVRASGGHLTVHGVDKFPRMTDYVVPAGVRIADASRVRLGAHLAEGTTVMHEGFVNFNAGTLGASIVERLSGGGQEQITVGERCLLGANSGIGISLGDDCVVEAGLYVTASTPVLTPDGVVKARELSGRSNLLFLRDGQTGKVIVRARSGSWGGLNTELHAN